MTGVRMKEKETLSLIESRRPESEREAREREKEEEAGFKC